MSDFKTNVTKLVTMLEMQDSMNALVYADWRERRFPWYRAIWTESAEMLEHIGWKWWKDVGVEADVAQVKLELVDIWHFGMSILIQNAQSSQYAEIAIQIGNPLFEPNAGAQTDIRSALETFVAHTLVDKHFHVQQFARLMALIGMSFDELYLMYVGKNVLNKFRQENGYKTGKYKKNWKGREDNIALIEIISTLNKDSSEFPILLMNGLSREYSNCN